MSAPKPPVARRVDMTLTAHGHDRSDPYYWLRSDDRSDPEVLAYLQAENAYTEAVLAPLAESEQSLFDEIVGRIKKDDASVPYRKRGYWYYSRFEEGKEYALSCRKRGDLDADEEVYFDSNREAEGCEFFSVGGMAISRDTCRLAYSIDTVGRRQYELRFRDLTTGADLPERIEDTTGAAVWAADNETVFYVRKEEGTLRAHQIWRHRLGTDPASDALVYEETDPEFFVYAWLSRSEDYVFIGSHHTLTREVRFIDAGAPESEPRVFLARSAGHEYSVQHAGGRFWIRSNFEAKNFRLLSTDLVGRGDPERWREEIPARADVFLGAYALFSDHLVVCERFDAQSRLRVIPLADRDAAHEIEFDESVFDVWIGHNPEYETGILRLGYTSMTTPSRVIDYDMVARTRELKKEEPVLGGFDRRSYATSRIKARAADGTLIPISLVHRADLDRGQPQPLLLYAYGSYGTSMDPGFSSARLSLLDRGFIYAIAHVRGGQEHGREWYERGKLLDKKNTFTDFIAATEHLIREGYTAADRCFAYGGSAGGLLMGAIANMRPELYRGIVATVPFVDVVTTMLDESIPLTTFEFDEWGNPKEKEYYEYMLSYSPYDNVEAREYPSMLVLTGLHDSQVQYWEPAKWVAKLRASKTDDERLLLWTDMDAGHGGASGRFKRHRQTARIYTFLLDQAGKL